MSALRDALEARLGTLPVMRHDNGYPSQALPKADLLDLLALHPDHPLADAELVVVHHHDIEKTAEHFNQGYAEACEQFEALLAEAREDLVLDGPARDLMGYLADSVKAMGSGGE